MWKFFFYDKSWKLLVYNVYTLTLGNSMWTKTRTREQKNDWEDKEGKMTKEAVE